MSSIDDILQPFHHFGVNLGLKRITKLLKDLGNPHLQVPIIHVAGSNGKGSVCAYVGSVLKEAGYKVGRYTSPHLIDWTERICINEEAIAPDVFVSVLLEVKNAIGRASAQAMAEDAECPTQFEMITAAAWLYFAREKVDIAVIEVGLGGRLDATNVCPHPLVTAIVSLSREHWQNLGPTLADIAREKAGILKSNCSVVIGNLPIEAKTVVAQKIEELNCPASWIEPAKELRRGEDGIRWVEAQGISYPLSLLGEMQLINSAIAIGIIKILQARGWSINSSAIEIGMGKTRWWGRLQWTTWRSHSLLIDGAHNPDAAKYLRQYVDTLAKPIVWLIGMLSTKDHGDIFQTLLRGGDYLYLVPVPDHSSAKPEDLALLAIDICPELEEVKTFPDVFVALEEIFRQTKITANSSVVLSGSLYLLGYFLKQNQLTREG